MKIFGLIISVMAFLFVASCDGYEKCKRKLMEDGYTNYQAATNCKHKLWHEKTLTRTSSLFPGSWCFMGRPFWKKNYNKIYKLLKLKKPFLNYFKLKNYGWSSWLST